MAGVLWTATGANKLLDSGVAAVTHVSACTDLSGTEASGVTRQAVTWSAAASRVKANSGSISIPVGAGNTVAWVGLFDAVSAGNLLGLAPLGAAAQIWGVANVLASSDTFTDLEGQTLAADDRVVFVAVEDLTLPTGLSSSTLYFVRATGLTSTAFTVATTSGGAAVDVTTDGSVFWMRTSPQPFVLAGNLTIANAQLSVSGAAFGS